MNKEKPVGKMDAIAERNNLESGAHEMRAYPRIDVSFDAVVRVQGTPEVSEGAVANLSGNGLRMMLSSAPEMGTLLSVLMQFDGDSVLTCAEVVWCVPSSDGSGHEVACRFVD